MLLNEMQTASERGYAMQEEECEIDLSRRISDPASHRSDNVRNCLKELSTPINHALIRLQS